MFVGAFVKADSVSLIPQARAEMLVAARGASSAATKAVTAVKWVGAMVGLSAAMKVVEKVVVWAGALDSMSGVE